MNNKTIKPKKFLIPYIILILCAVTFFIIALFQETKEKFLFYDGLVFIILGILSLFNFVILTVNKRRILAILFLFIAFGFFLISWFFMT